MAITDVRSRGQLVEQIVSTANRPLTLAEIKAEVEAVRPIGTANADSTLRADIYGSPLIISLGGRPAHYVWLPDCLAGCSFRQPLASSDLETGTLVLGVEAWVALWPEFRGSGCYQKHVVLLLDSGRELRARIEHLVPGQAVWGVGPTPGLAEWYERAGATVKDELILRAGDVASRGFEVALRRRAEREEPAIDARNKALADVAELVMRAGRPPLSHYRLACRLIGRQAYRDPVPPDPLEDVLRADLRFITLPHEVWLAMGLVDSLERDPQVVSAPDAAPKPRGDRTKARSEKLRRDWGEYLFDQGMENLWAGFSVGAEAYYREALRLDPGHADAWNHMGLLAFEEGRVAAALSHFERARVAAEARTVGDPDEYPGPFWGDLQSRPFMRALHGKGLCLWRLGRADEAGRVFSQMLRLNPNDNQGVRFLLYSLRLGLSWEEQAAREQSGDSRRVCN